MKILISQYHTHHFIEEIDLVDHDMLQFDVHVVDHPRLPTYGMRVDITGITDLNVLKQLLKDKILERIAEIQEQINRDANARGKLESWGWFGELETNGWTHS